MNAAASTATLVNVTFGDVWHCSGQSNMWLPVSHSFTSNATYEAILAGKYNNLRVMMGNSGNGDTAFSNPWTAVRNGVFADEDDTNTHGLGQFGAACW